MVQPQLELHQGEGELKDGVRHEVVGQLVLQEALLALTDHTLQSDLRHL